MTKRITRSFLILLAARSLTLARDFNLVPINDLDAQVENEAPFGGEEKNNLQRLRPTRNAPLNSYGAARQNLKGSQQPKGARRNLRKTSQQQPAAKKGGMMAPKKQQQKQQQMAMPARKAAARQGPAEALAPAEQGFDFIIAGFPKCGTTTLLKAFGVHEETDMAASEQCAIASPFQADAKVHRLLDQTLTELSTDPAIKRSFKCPTAMYNYKSIARMEKHSPNAKFVVGMRHPVKMLQSFYNYRITEIKERGLDEPIPPLDEILDSGSVWKGVSMQSTRFELFLMQMGKTTVSATQMKDLVGQNYDLAIKPSNFTVFLYTVDQLDDADVDRSENLRTTMQKYIGLKKPIQAFGHENKNHATGKAAHSESISICDDKWANVRAKLVQQGARTAQWLQDEFIHSKDVVVANKEHFIETISTWAVDPCVKTAQS